MPHEIKLDGELPMVCVVGGGLAGLLTAIEVKEENASLQVIVLDKSQVESNTLVSGMRIRAKRATSDANTPENRREEVTELLGEQNNGVITPPMKEFARILTEEIKIWNQRLLRADPEFVRELPEWFGPQWGKLNQNQIAGRGESVLTWLRSVASKKGVKFLLGEAQALHKEDEIITSMNLISGDRKYTLRPDVVVLANGSATGSLFLSTNRPIRNSAIQLLFNTELPLEGGTLVMWHPFGKCKSDGSPILGCHGTDALEETNVFFMSGIKDEKTTQLLREHQAHNRFEEISRRFLDNGGVIRLVDTNGEQRFARVSLHYSHLGARTIDGTGVAGTTNLAVVGDAGGLLYWTNYQTRLPGFALAHCLVSARKASHWINSVSDGDRFVAVENGRRLTEIVLREQVSTASQRGKLTKIREINTRHILQMEFGDEGKKGEQISSWKAELNQMSVDGATLLSLAIVDGWEHLIEGEREPIPITANQEVII